MMQWLLKHEGYPPAVIVSVLLHGLLLLLIFFWNRDHQDLLRIEQPAAVVATAVKENPQRVRRQEQQEIKRKQQQQVAQEREQVREQERQHKEILVKEEAERLKIAQLHKQQDLDQKRKQDDQKQLEKKQQEQKLQEQKQQEQKQQTVAKEQELKREKEKQQREEAQRQTELARQQVANQRALTEEQQLVASYTGKIQDLIESFWNRPAGVRKDTVALVELQLTPTGEIAASGIVQSSGDANFDRSVLLAVNKAGRFSFLKELDYAVFNRYFRKFTLEFKPGDL